MISQSHREFMHAYLQWAPGTHKTNTSQPASPLYYVNSKKKVELTWTVRYTIKPVPIGPALPDIT